MIKLFSSLSFSGELEVPSDKSISHRSALLNSIANGKSKILNYSNGEDCLSTLGVLKELGVDLSKEGRHCKTQLPVISFSKIKLFKI